MSVCFAEKLKQLRKENDYTQEQIADIFHVSPQAVSRWETGATSPDIELLPHIAVFFKVTVDALLGTEAIRGGEKVTEFKKEIRNLLNSGRLYDAMDAARRAVREYPANCDLQDLLLKALCTACADTTPGFEENTRKYKKEILAIGERILRSFPNNLDAKFLLIRQYVKWGMKEEANSILSTLPEEAYHTQDYTLGHMGYDLEGEQWPQNQKYRIIRFTIMLCDLLGVYAREAALAPLEKIQCYKAAMQIESLTNSISGNDEEDNHIQGAFLNICIAELYCEEGDRANALLHVENAVQDSLHHKEVMDQTNEDGSNYYPWATPRNLCWILWEDHLTKPQFDCIRGSERFVTCFETLQAHSVELKQ